MSVMNAMMRKLLSGVLMSESCVGYGVLNASFSFKWRYVVGMTCNAIIIMFEITKLFKEDNFIMNNFELNLSFVALSSRLISVHLK